MDQASALQIACRNGYVDAATSILARNRFPSYVLTNGLTNACQNGHIRIVRQLILNGANEWNAGLFFACIGGHRRIVDLMIRNGANLWNQGLFAASYPGHESIVRLMVSKGADDWNAGLERAYEGLERAYDRRKNIDILSLMLRRGASNAASVFVLPADADLLFDLLTSTPVGRQRLSAVCGVESVFARLDDIAAAVDSVLAVRCYPAVLRRLIIGFCVS
jgi:ankyrin repeat protein